MDMFIEVIRDAIVGIVSASATYFFAYLIEKSKQKYQTIEREDAERDDTVLSFFGIARDVVNRRSSHPEFDIAYGKASVYLPGDTMRIFLSFVKSHDYDSASAMLDEIVSSYVSTSRKRRPLSRTFRPRKDSR